MAVPEFLRVSWEPKGTCKCGSLVLCPRMRRCQRVELDRWMDRTGTPLSTSLCPLPGRIPGTLAKYQYPGSSPCRTTESAFLGCQGFVKLGRAFQRADRGEDPC